MLKFMAVCLMVLALGGCAAGTPFSYDKARQVKVGMPEDQVIELMGNPYSVASRDGAQMWVWTHVNLMAGSSRVVSFKLKDGKVIEVPAIPSTFE